LDTDAAELSDCNCFATVWCVGFLRTPSGVEMCTAVFVEF